MARQFYPLSQFAKTPKNFTLLPFRFMRLNGKELIVNEAGEFLFAPNGTVQRLVDGQLDPSSVLYRDLKAKQVLFDDASSALLDLLGTKIRSKFDHLQGGTKLHIFVVTLRCEHSCHYCQVSRQTTSRGEYDMSTQSPCKPRTKLQINASRTLSTHG